jgi:hypothetical protein
VPTAFGFAGKDDKFDPDCDEFGEAVVTDVCDGVCDDVCDGVEVVIFNLDPIIEANASISDDCVDDMVEARGAEATFDWFFSCFLL